MTAALHTVHFSGARQKAPLINSTVLTLSQDGEQFCQAVHCNDTPDTLMIGFTSDGGHHWYGYHTQRGVTLDEFQARFTDYQVCDGCLPNSHADECPGTEGCSCCGLDRHNSKE